MSNQEQSKENSSQSNTELNTTTHLVMSLAEERTSERQTFELEAKRVKNRRQVRSKVLLQRLQTETMRRRKK